MDTADMDLKPSGKGPSRRLVGVSAALVVALLIAAFAWLASASPRRPAHSRAAIATVTPTPTPAPTATATPRPTPYVTGLLTWQTRTLPAGFDVHNNTGAFVVAPTDGATAYACAGSSVWATRDGAQTWTDDTQRIPASTSGSSSSSGDCLITVDGLDARTAMLDVGHDPQSGCPLARYVTHDGGASWSAVSLPSGACFNSIATRNGVTYAIQTTAVSGQGLQSALVASNDGWRTWRNIGIDFQGNLMAFWADANSDTLLVWANTGDIGQILWTSSDGGAHWAQAASQNVGGYVVQTQRPTGGGPWRICAQQDTPGASAHLNSSLVVTCSDDGGYSWATMPALDPSLQFPELFAVTADGSLLAEGGPDTSQPVQHTIYRLARGAGSWQKLGQTPPMKVVYRANPGHGALWVTPQIGGLGSFPQAEVLVASYP